MAFLTSDPEPCMRRLAALLLLTLVARPVLGQSEDAIRAAFEGKTVRVKIEMPGSDDGVDIYPGTAAPWTTYPNMRAVSKSSERRTGR